VGTIFPPPAVPDEAEKTLPEESILKDASVNAPVAGLIIFGI
jgi:hypothetical protein